MKRNPQFKRWFKLKECINTDIKIGDKVRINDGSGLCFVDGNNYEQVKANDIYIVLSYPQLFNSPLNLDTLVFTVKETGISNISGSPFGSTTLFKLDCVIERDGIELYSMSQSLTKIQK